MLPSCRLPLVQAAVLFLFASTLSSAANAAGQASVRVIAAESSYGSIVRTIGGPHVEVTSLLDSPDVDPHAFKASPDVARQISGADLVIMNGLGYDAWMEKLLQGSAATRRKVIVASMAASYLILPNRNPHLFYSPRAMLVTASHIAHALAELDPAHSADYAAGLARFREQLLPVYAHVQQLIAAYPQLTVAATEPVYGYMLHLLGYRILYQKLQFATMNGSQPSARQVAAFTQGLNNGTVDLLVFNRQVHDRLTQSLVATAKKAGVAVVGVTEMPLHGKNYVKWQIGQLQAVRRALDNSK